MRIVALLVALLPAFAQARTQIVATLPALASLAREVGGPDAEVEVLTSRKQDPHYADPRPDLVLKLNRADVLFANGLDLEVGWLPTLQNAARNPKIILGSPGYVQASFFVRAMEVPLGRIDRAQGDIHPGGNPHFAYDARQLALVARGLAQRLGVVDPAHAAGYAARGEALASKLDALAAREAARFRALPEHERQLVTYHRSFIYLTDWLGLRSLMEVEPKPGIMPDPGHVARVLSTLRASGADVILQEAYYPTNVSRTLAQLARARMVLIEAGPDFAAGEGVVPWLERITEELHRALAPR